MKNKKLTYILFPLVIVVWGLVIYRIFFESTSVPDNISVVSKSLIKEITEEDQKIYKLIADYRDPFLSDVKQLNTVVEAEDNKEESLTPQSNMRRRRNDVSRVRWPEIKYGGYIEGNGKSRTTILLNVQNKDYLAYVGDTVYQVYIKDFYKDSLIVVYQEEEKTLIK